MSNQDLEKIYKDIRKRLYARYENRKEFAIHAAIFTISMFLLWLVIFSPSDFGDGGFFIGIATVISCLWAIGFVAHWVDFSFNEMRENAIDREIERTRLFGNGGKLKNEQFAPDESLGMRLREDGEFVDFDYADEEENSRHNSA